MSTYMDCLPAVAAADVSTLREKDKAYGGSWKKRGGIGAFMMLARKWDRLENYLQSQDYDIFAAIENDRRDEGILDDIQDLRRYLLLVEAEIVSRGLNLHIDNTGQEHPHGFNAAEEELPPRLVPRHAVDK